MLHTFVYSPVLACLCPVLTLPYLTPIGNGVREDVDGGVRDGQSGIVFSEAILKEELLRARMYLIVTQGGMVSQPMSGCPGGLLHPVLMNERASWYKLIPWVDRF